MIPVLGGVVWRRNQSRVVWESDTGDGHPALKYSGSRVWPLEGDNKKDIYQSERWSNNGNNGRKTIGNWYNTILQAAGFPPQNHFGRTDPNLREIDIKGPLAELV